MKITTIDEVKGDESSANDNGEGDEKIFLFDKNDPQESQGDKDIEEEKAQLAAFDKLSRSESSKQWKIDQGEAQDLPLHEIIGHHLR